MNSKEHVLSDENTPRILFKLSLPAVAGMLVMAVGQLLGIGGSSIIS